MTTRHILMYHFTYDSDTYSVAIGVFNELSAAEKAQKELNAKSGSPFADRFNFNYENTIKVIDIIRKKKKVSFIEALNLTIKLEPYYALYLNELYGCDQDDFQDEYFEIVSAPQCF